MITTKNILKVNDDSMQPFMNISDYGIFVESNKLEVDGLYCIKEKNTPATTRKIVLLKGGFLVIPVNQDSKFKTELSLRYKNDIYKFLRSILNYGVKWHSFNFNSVYNKMTKFQDPNERRKEMLYYNYDEFKKFISYEPELRWRCVFEILYFCGLRKGELKGLTWKDIYFAKRILSVNK